MTSYLFAFLLCLFSAVSLHAQDIAVGAWRNHLAYFNGQKVAVSPTHIYCASENGLFALNLTDNSLQTIGKLDGLSDNGIADLAYHTPTQTLVIAYQNGNIDLLREDEIINVRSILNSNRPDKRIFQVTLGVNGVYMATAFGGLYLNLINVGIGDVYENIGGFASKGKQIGLTNTHIYLLTDAGVFRVSRDATTNPQDFAQWEQLSNIPINTEYITIHEGELHYFIPNSGVYRYENNTPVLLPELTGASIQFLESIDTGLAIGTSTGVQLYTNSTVSFFNNPLVLNSQDIAVNAQGIWLADARAGLVLMASNETKNYIPTGTLTSQAFRLITAGRKIVAVSGGFNEQNLQAYGQKLGFYVFEKGIWRNFTSEENLIGASPIPDVSDISSAAYDAVYQRIYLGTYGNGILIWSLSTDEITLNATGPQRVTGLAVDSQGILWATAIDGGLYSLANDIWKLEVEVSRAVDLVVDAFDSQWLRLGDSGLLLRQGTQQRFLRHQENQGNLRGARVRSLAVDQDGSVWAGTTDGITTFFDAFFVLAGEDGSTLFGEEGLPLHQGETVTAIAIDGGQRKWIGTQNGGVWLYDNDGRLIETFTTTNSPLLSNNIQSIAIEPVTGEIFFATDQGIISYRSTATQGGRTHQNVKVFPNPVRPDYQGLISISGLVTNASVRLTDTAGQLVWKGEATGGTVAWNRLNFQGQRVKTGIYLLFSSNGDGQETFVAKIAVIE